MKEYIFKNLNNNCDALQNKTNGKFFDKKNPINES